MFQPIISGINLRPAQFSALTSHCSAICLSVSLQLILMTSKDNFPHIRDIWAEWEEGEERRGKREVDVALNLWHAVRIRVLLNFNDVAGLAICINVLLSHTSAQFWPKGRHREMANSCQLTFKPYLIRLLEEVRTRKSQLSTLSSQFAILSLQSLQSRPFHTNNSVCKKYKHNKLPVDCEWVNCEWVTCEWLSGWVVHWSIVCKHKLLRQCQHAKFFLPQRWQMTTSWTHAF